MSKSKRLEKEIDYIKSIITILVALCAGIVAWFVRDDTTNLFFQILGIILFLIFLYGIIYSNKKIKKLLDELEVTND